MENNKVYGKNDGFQQNASIFTRFSRASAFLLFESLACAKEKNVTRHAKQRIKAEKAIFLRFIAQLLSVDRYAI